MNTCREALSDHDGRGETLQATWSVPGADGAPVGVCPGRGLTTAARVAFGMCSAALVIAAFLLASAQSTMSTRDLDTPRTAVTPSVVSVTTGP